MCMGMWARVYIRVYVYIVVRVYVINLKYNENKTRQGKKKNVCEKFQPNYARYKSEAGKNLNQILFLFSFVCIYVCMCDFDCVLFFICVCMYVTFCACSSSSCIFGWGQVGGGYSKIKCINT